MGQRFRFGILGTASALTMLLLASSASQAVSPNLPKMNLGLLKPVDKWKVGPVSANGASYCAMVGRFDKQAVLAFAQSAGGYASLAIDFRENFFQSGQSYSVTLKPQALKPRNFSARASSARSIIIQIGQNDAFLKTIKDNDLAISLPTIDASFALRQFANAYQNLSTCTQTVASSSSDITMPAAAVASVEKADLAGHTGEAQRLSDEIARKDAALKQKEEQLNRLIAEKTKESEQKLAALDQQKQDLSRQVDAKKEELKSLENTAQKQSVRTEVSSSPVTSILDRGRKLLASTSDPAPAVPLEPVPLTAGAAQQQDIKQTISTADAHEKQSAVKLEVLQKAMAEKEKQIADLEKARSSQAAKDADTLAKQDADAKQRFATLQQEREALEQKLSEERSKKEEALASLKNIESGKQSKIQADLVARQQDIARMAEEHQLDTSALQKKMANSQAEFDSKLKTVMAERDQMKAELDQSGRDLADARQSLQKLEQKLKEAEAQYQMESERAAKAESALKTAQAEIDSLKNGLNADQKKLTDLQAALDRRQSDLDQREADLEKRAEAQKISSAGELSDAQKEIERLKGENQALEQQMSTQEKDLLASIASRVEEITPSAGPEVTAAPTEPVQSSALSSADITWNAPAVAAVEPATGQNDADAPPKTGINKAAAFLDRVMGYHRRQAVVASKPTEEKEAAPAVPAVKAEMPVTPAAPQKVEVVTDISLTPEPQQPEPPVVAEQPEVLPVQPPVSSSSSAAMESERKLLATTHKATVTEKPSSAAVPAVAQQQAEILSDPVPEGASAPAIIPAATSLASERPSFLPQAGVSEPPALDSARTEVEGTAFKPQEAEKTMPQIESAPPVASVEEQALVTPVVSSAPPAVLPVTLEDVLRQTGFSDVAFVPVVSGSGNNVRQWTVDASGHQVSGMFEEIKSTPVGVFGDPVQTYLNRYRDDCKDQLDVRVRPMAASAAGNITVADIMCSIPSNSYSTSFVFIQKDGAFLTVAHSSENNNAGEVQAISNRVAEVVAGSGGIFITAPAAAPAVAAAPVSLRFNIPPAQDSAKGEPVDASQFKTLVVQ